MDASTAASPRLGRWLDEAERLDVAVYTAIAHTSTPAIDREMSRLSRAADYSRLSLASAAVTATVANLIAKPLGRRRRPDRIAQEVPLARQVRMPVSSSFPSGHSAAAFAFSTGVAQVSPEAAAPLRALAALVAYSRVHTGVHYPGDVAAGSLLGMALAEVTAHWLDGRLR